MAYQYEAGFIGAGNMGGALARAAVKTVGGAAVAVACSTAEHSAKAAASIGCAAETAEAILPGEPIRVLGSEAPDVCRCDGKAGGGHCGV